MLSKNLSVKIFLPLYRFQRLFNCVYERTERYRVNNAIIKTDSNHAASVATMLYNRHEQFQSKYNRCINAIIVCEYPLQKLTRNKPICNLSSSICRHFCCLQRRQWSVLHHNFSLQAIFWTNSFISAWYFFRIYQDLLHMFIIKNIDNSISNLYQW